ncbi:MAG: TIGR03086 family protein, partial [Actinomadura sp.]
MHERASAPCPGPRGRGLLERAVGFALASVRAVTPAMMPRRTPCASWNLEMLLLHLDDSLTALYEGAASGRVALERPPPAGDGEPVSSVRLSAVRLLRATGAPARVGVGDRGLGRDLMAAAGAVEVAAHGWDVAQASGERRPVPAGLADDLLGVCPLVVPQPRGALFA